MSSEYRPIKINNSLYEVHIKKNGKNGWYISLVYRYKNDTWDRKRILYLLDDLSLNGLCYSYYKTKQHAENKLLDFKIENNLFRIKIPQEFITQEENDTMKKLKRYKKKEETRRDIYPYLTQLSHKLKEDIGYAEAMYASLCNMKWKHISSGDIYSCTWRYAGGLIAELRDKGENYLDFYCNGKEGYVREDIIKDLRQLGWKPKPWTEEELK